MSVKQNFSFCVFMFFLLITLNVIITLREDPFPFKEIMNILCKGADLMCVNIHLDKKSSSVRHMIGFESMILPSIVCSPI